KGYRKVNGCSENNAVLKALVHRATKNNKKTPCAFAFIDMAKAFDTVSHESIILACKRVGIPEILLSYLENLYSKAYTSLQGQCNAKFNRGILQGDPLSGYIFNFVLDWVLDLTLNTNPASRHPVKIGSAPVDALLFADDTVLVSRDLAGLQNLATNFINNAARVGLSPNPAKCAFTSIRTYNNSYYIDAAQKVNIAGQEIHPMNLSQTYKYLGIRFSPIGIVFEDLWDIVKKGVSNIMSSHLTKFQKYVAVRDYMMPRLNYTLTHGRVRFNDLKKIDLYIRASIRGMLGLSHDTPTEFYHAATAAGGLGIPELTVLKDLLRNARAQALRESDDPIIKEMIAATPQLFQIKRINIGGFSCTKGAEAKDLYVRSLHSKVDTEGLSSTKEGDSNFLFLRIRELNIRDSDFARACQMMASSVPTKSKYSRFKTLPGGNKCESCHDKVKNLAHILQTCPRAQGARMIAMT
ncbi:Uncharacterized protein FKW44_001491, partial [Caligus rogercresseyi]